MGINSILRCAWGFVSCLSLPARVRSPMTRALLPDAAPQDRNHTWWRVRRESTEARLLQEVCSANERLCTSQVLGLILKQPGQKDD